MSVALPIVAKPSSIVLPPPYSSALYHHRYVHAVLQQSSAKLQLTPWHTSYWYACQQYIAGRAGKCLQGAIIVSQSHSGNNTQVQAWCGGYGRGSIARKEERHGSCDGTW